MSPTSYRTAPPRGMNQKIYSTLATVSTSAWEICVTPVNLPRNRSMNSSSLGARRLQASAGLQAFPIGHNN